MNDYRNYTMPVSKAIFTTSDKGAYAVHSLFKSDSYLCEKALAEYIYLKAFIFVLIMRHGVKNEAPDVKATAEAIISETFAILDNAFRHDPSGYGCSIYSLNERISFYYSKVNPNNLNTLCAAYTDILGSDNLFLYGITIDKILFITDSAFEHIQSTINTWAKNNRAAKAASGSGCLLPVIAFMLLFCFLALI